MARLVAGYGSSHSPMLAVRLEDWLEQAFGARDRARQHCRFQWRVVPL